MEDVAGLDIKLTDSKHRILSGKLYRTVEHRVHHMRNHCFIDVSKDALKYSGDR